VAIISSTKLSGSWKSLRFWKLFKMVAKKELGVLDGFEGLLR
jgi:hypothetical protein